MSLPIDVPAAPALAIRHPWRRISLVALGLWVSVVVGLVVAGFLVDISGLGAGPNSWGYLAAAVIVLVMACAWAFALPASAFLLITPLLFPPHVSVAITTAGCAIGAGLGYLVARFVGGWWVERFRDGRLARFLARHSSFLVLFGIRLAPGGPHGFINYAAGLAAIPYARFVVATTCAFAIKSYVYALAVHNTVGARSLADALSARAMLSLLAVALLALAGHVLRRRHLRIEEPDASAHG